MKKLIAWISFVVLLIGLLSACGSPQPIQEELASPAEVEESVPEANPTAEEEQAQPAVDAQKRGGEIVFAITNDPTTLDPHKVVEGVAYDVLRLLGDTLVTKAPDGSYVGELAESWEVSEDGLVYTFYLKHGVKFHNETDLTAEDFVFTFERALDPDTQAAFAGVYLEPVESVNAVDDFTLQINLKNPFYAFLNGLTSMYLQPLSPEALEEWGDEYGRHPVGVGPYRFKSWQIGDEIVLERNENYNWGPAFAHEGPWYFDTAMYKIIGEYSTIIAAMEAGEVDYYASIQISDKESLAESGEFEVLSVPHAGADPLLVMNLSNPKFEDINVRRALSYAMDREAQINILALGEAEPQYGPISPTVIGYWEGVEEIGYRYDPEKAKELLLQSGYTLDDEGFFEKGGERLKLELNTLSVGNLPQIAQVLQQQLQDIGIEVEIVQQELGVALDQIFGCDYELTMFGVDTDEADILYMAFHSSQIGVLNFICVEDPELDEILNKTRTTVEPDQRQQYVNQAQEYIIENAYIIPLYAKLDYYAISKQIQGGVFSSKTANMYFDDAYFEEN